MSQWLGSTILCFGAYSGYDRRRIGRREWLNNNDTISRYTTSATLNICCADMSSCLKKKKDYGVLRTQWWSGQIRPILLGGAAVSLWSKFIKIPSPERLNGLHRLSEVGATDRLIQSGSVCRLDRDHMSGHTRSPLRFLLFQGNDRHVLDRGFNRFDPANFPWDWIIIQHSCIVSRRLQTTTTG